eukprot:8315000-Pyramimonas_sp.AAC.1
MRPVDAPGAPDLAHLSLHEFIRYWRVELAAFPRSGADIAHSICGQRRSPGGTDAFRTPEGSRG